MSTKQPPQARVGTRVPRPRKDGRNRITTTKARARTRWRATLPRTGRAGLSLRSVNRHVDVLSSTVSYFSRRSDLTVKV